MDYDVHQRLLFFAFLLYVLVLLGVQTGHLFWLLTIHTELRAAYDKGPQTAMHAWGFAGAAFLLIIIVAGPFCVLGFIRKYAEVECSWMGGRQWLMFFWPISLVIYNGQVIVFLVSTVNLYLELKWGTGEATCACHTDVDPLLNVSSPLLDHCQCLVPRDDCAYQVTALDSSLITDEDLQRRGSEYTGNVTVEEMGSLEDVLAWVESADLDKNFQYMLVLIKASALVTVIHFPLWLLDHYLIQMAASIKGDVEDADAPNVSTRKTISEIVSELMVHTIYCFSENIDGFSLLDEYLETSEYFWRNGYLRDAILAFLGTNILLVASYNGVARLLHGYTLVSLIVRCLIVILNNLPFMIIRIYMLWTLGGDQLLESKINTNLFFFVSKEAVFLIVYFMECGFSIYQYRKDKKDKTNYTMDVHVPKNMGSQTSNHSDCKGEIDYSDQDENDRVVPRSKKGRKPKLTHQDSFMEEGITGNFTMSIDVVEEPQYSTNRRKRPRNRQSNSMRNSSRTSESDRGTTYNEAHGNSTQKLSRNSHKYRNEEN